jgi:hypothetical protein
MLKAWSARSALRRDLSNVDIGGHLGRSRFIDRNKRNTEILFKILGHDPIEDIDSSPGSLTAGKFD